MPQNGQPPALTVSVAMCTYNGAAFVEAQLLSVLAQTYPLREILIFDDGSTDDTVAILRRMAAGYPVISLHQNPVNLGYTRNFEQALLAATGDAIAICDQDDVWVKDKIEKMVQAWKPECPLIYCFSHMFQQQLPPSIPRPSPLIRKFEGTDPRKIFMYNSVSGHATMVRRSLLSLAVPFSAKVPYDWWLGVVAACNGGVQYFPEVLVFQRKHHNNVTLDDHRYSRQFIKDRHKQEMVDNNLLFATAPNMPQVYRRFALKLAHLAKESQQHAFYKPLFLFLLRYRRILFNIKRRKIEVFSHIKNSYRRTKR